MTHMGLVYSMYSWSKSYWFIGERLPVLFCYVNTRILNMYICIVLGTQSTACSSGNYYLTRIPDTNTYLLVIDNWEDTLTDTNIGIGCLVERT